MSLLRFVGRALFSSYYVSEGFQQLTKPDQNVDQIAPTVDRIVPAVQSMLPPDTADRVPEDARTWTRVLGLAQVVGGVAYATGIARRPGALLLAVATLPRVIGAATSEDRSGLFTQLALFGGTLVATQDTAGQPSLAWRAQQSRKAVGDRAHKSRKAVEAQAKSAGKQADRTRKAISKQAGQLSDAATKSVKQVRRQVKDALH